MSTPIKPVKVNVVLELKLEVADEADIRASVDRAVALWRAAASWRTVCLGHAIRIIAIDELPAASPGRVMNLSHEIGLALACAQGLRTAAAACDAHQNVLKARLQLSADQLEKLASLSARAIDRIDVLDGALRECIGEMEAWDRMEDRTSSTRAALERAQRALATTLRLGGAS